MEVIMYKELVTLLRKKYDKAPLVMEAADAIEKLSMKLNGDEAAIAGMKREIERLVKGNPRRIPVTERLPERYDDDVLCHVCNVDSNRHFISVGNYSRVFRMWDLDTEWATSRDVVTHWMPLPGNAYRLTIDF